MTVIIAIILVIVFIILVYSFGFPRSDQPKSNIKLSSAIKSIIKVSNTGKRWRRYLDGHSDFVLRDKKGKDTTVRIGRNESLPFVIWHKFNEHEHTDDQQVVELNQAEADAVLQKVRALEQSLEQEKKEKLSKEIEKQIK